LANNLGKKESEAEITAHFADGEKVKKCDFLVDSFANSISARRAMEDEEKECRRHVYIEKNIQRQCQDHRLAVTSARYF